MTTAPTTPRNTNEALIVCDALLTELTPRYNTARTALLDLQPGHSGRPAGNGEPAGGKSSVSTTSVVERTATLEHVNPERTQLDRLETLPARLVADMAKVIEGYGGRLPALPTLPTPGQRLTWVAWAVRVCIQLHHATGRRARDGDVRRLHEHIDELYALVHTTTTDPTMPTAERAAELATDLTDMWCRSCLRVGQRSARSDRYTDGLCDWCGKFIGGQGFLPTLDLLDTHHTGKRITEAMVNAARQTLLGPPPKKRRKRRK